MSFREMMDEMFRLAEAAKEAEYQRQDAKARRWEQSLEPKPFRLSDVRRADEK